MASFTGSAFSSNFGMSNLASAVAAFKISVTDAAELVKTELKNQSPYGVGTKQPGTMISKIKRWDLVISPRMATARVGWQATDFSAVGLYFYPPAVDLGSGKRGPKRAYIRPKFAPFLRYEYDGGWVSLRKSMGQKPQNIINKTIAVCLPKIMSLCGRNIMVAATRFGK